MSCITSPLLFVLGQFPSLPDQRPPLSRRYSSSSSFCCQVSPPLVALTRERGKNGSLSRRLLTLPVRTVELPCVETVSLPLAVTLPSILENEHWDWVLVTSIEGAKVLVHAWEAAEKPRMRVGAVGGVTAEWLRKGGVEVGFVPLVAKGANLARELDVGEEGRCRVLYVASKRAAGEVERELGRRRDGVEVKRLDCYDTRDRVWKDEEREVGAKVDVVTFGSPSAVDGWLGNLGVSRDIIVACIGETSGKRAKQVGFEKVLWPEAPGMDGWVETVRKALAHLRLVKADEAIR